MNNNEELVSSTQPSTSKRLFFALWLDEDVTQTIQDKVIKHFKHCQGRILGENNWHITLAYFGTADVKTQSCLEEQAEKIKSQPFELNLSKCGFWPRPKVAWLAPEKIPDALKQLTNDLQSAIKPCGFKPDTKNNQPHITLVRKAKSEPSVANVSPINLKVSKFCLMESKTEPEGAKYTVLKSWNL